MGRQLVSVKLELEDAPNWLSHIEISQEDDDHILIEVVRTNGSSCGFHRISKVGFNNLADLIITAKE